MNDNSAEAEENKVLPGTLIHSSGTGIPIRRLSSSQRQSICAVSGSLVEVGCFCKNPNGMFTYFHQLASYTS